MKSEIPQQLMDGFQSNFDHDLFMVSKRSQMTFSLAARRLTFQYLEYSSKTEYLLWSFHLLYENIIV